MLNSRQLQRGCHRVNLHCSTSAAAKGLGGGAGANPWEASSALMSLKNPPLLGAAAAAAGGGVGGVPYWWGHVNKVCRVIGCRRSLIQGPVHTVVDEVDSLAIL